MEGGTIPPGPAVDLGCGDGVITRYIARFHRPVVGVDVALAAARRAALGRDGGPDVSFVVAEVPAMPLREGYASFVFDRGCLQHLPRRLWTRYFAEVERLLRPGGALQLFVSGRDPAASRVGGRVRSSIRRVRRWRTGKGPASTRLLRRLLPSSMDAVETTTFRFRGPAGKSRSFVHLLARKRVEGPWTSG
jgi:SAM-dependent methyltransferase